MITIFTPSFADEANTNAQNLSVKEILARLNPARFAVTLLHEGPVDPRIASRANTTLLRWHRRGNTARIVWHIVKNVPDIYFFPREGPLDAVFLSLRRYWKFKTAVISYVVSGGLYSEPYSQSRARHIREADAVVANNSYLAQLLQEKMAVAATVLYDGVDPRYFFPPAVDRTSPDVPIVFFAGSLRPYKRVPFVVRQAARLPQVRFRIAGIGEEEQICKRLAVDLRCTNIEFLGHLPVQRIGEEMRRADIFFFPSVVEGHPQVLGQAAACGLPIIASQIYRPDYVVNGVTGFLADTDNEFSAKLDLLVNDSDLRRKMATASIAHVQKFDWDVIAGQWQETFEHVLSRDCQKAKPA
jgi:glycosyltransferase involved in cell wall biosynthesis